MARIVAVLCALFLAADTAADNTLARAADFLQRGQFQSAADLVNTAVQARAFHGNSADAVRAHVQLADAYRNLGMAASSRIALQDAMLEARNDRVTQAQIGTRLARNLRESGNHSEAAAAAAQTIVLAQELGRNDLLAAAQVELGNVHTAQGDTTAARTAFETGLALARRNGLDSLTAAAATSLARLHVTAGEHAAATSRLNESLQAARALAPSYEKLNRLLAIGKLHAAAARSGTVPQSWRRIAFDVFQEVLQRSNEWRLDRLASYALGYIGELYADEGRPVESLAMSAAAISRAAAADAKEARYLWEWQAARAHAALGDATAAANAYRRAIDTLSSVRTGLILRTPDAYRELIAPLYFEMADLLLRHNRQINDSARARANLREVRDTLEKLKVAEVVDYFDNECVILDESAAALEQLSSRAAVIYPVLLDDRMELLVSLPDGIQQFTVNVGKQRLTETVRAFRKSIERPAAEQGHLALSRRLFDWLIAPIAAELEASDTDTLVFVPDGPLRTIPMAALHDGKQFLVEQYALATTPGLSLTNPRPISRDDVYVLANGLTEGVQGFSPLPNVSAELDQIAALYPTRTNRDESFRIDTVERSMSEGSYSIVHIATHGQFAADHRNSFLLTYDDKLTMGRLETALGARRFQEEPIELLVLSACETAAGDDRAALGMAGVALKAGARSAVASLWFVNDASTSQLMSDFYQQLENPANSKAQALRQAQVRLLSDPQFRHPAYWAPFLLIGNWL